MNIGFKVTIEYVLPNMMDEDVFLNHYDGNMIKALRAIVEEDESMDGYATETQLVKIELI